MVFAVETFTSIERNTGMKPMFFENIERDMTEEERYLQRHVHHTVELGHGTKLGRFCVIDKNVKIGAHCFIGHNTVIRENVVLRDWVTIGHNVVIETNTVIKDGTTIQSNSHITKNAEIGEYVYTGPSICMINENHIAAFGRAEQNLEGPVIKDFVRIGARALIMPGVEVGENAVVGAGCLLNKNVPEKEIWFGHPAVHHGRIREDEVLNEERIREWFINKG